MTHPQAALGSRGGKCFSTRDGVSAVFPLFSQEIWFGLPFSRGG